MINWGVLWGFVLGLIAGVLACDIAWKIRLRRWYEELAECLEE